MTQYEKMRLALRYYLLGKGWYRAVNALEYGESIHTGTRKDGVTPEFEHQVRIAHYLRTLDVMFPEETIAVALLHDVQEDYKIPDFEMERRFGIEILRPCQLLNKTGKSPGLYFAEIATCPIASLAKGGDRIHNLQTMVGVFKPEKQMRYIAEVEQSFMPMLKEARRAFPQQERAYENIKHVLDGQVAHIKAINNESDVC